MNRLYFFILFFSICLNTQTFANCFIETSAKIYRPQKTQGISKQDIIKQSDCSEKIQKHFVEIVLGATGKLNSKSLQRILSNEVNDFDITIKPSTVEVFTLNNILKETFQLSANWFFKDLTASNKKKVYLLTEDQFLHFSCTSCRFTGEKRILIETKNITQDIIQKDWVKGFIKVRVKALVAKRNLNVNNTALTLADFSFQNVETNKPEQLFTNKNKLIFFKLNKPFQVGQTLNYSDIMPVNLVTSGQLVNISLENGFMKLSDKAIPLRSGKFGETIQLKHPKTKKIIIGKVIDFNKVIVEL